MDGASLDAASSGSAETKNSELLKDAWVNDEFPKGALVPDESTAETIPLPASSPGVSPAAAPTISAVSKVDVEDEAVVGFENTSTKSNISPGPYSEVDGEVPLTADIPANHRPASAPAAQKTVVATERGAPLTGAPLTGGGRTWSFTPESSSGYSSGTVRSGMSTKYVSQQSPPPDQELEKLKQAIVEYETNSESLQGELEHTLKLLQSIREDNTSLADENRELKQLLTRRGSLPPVSPPIESDEKLHQDLDSTREELRRAQEHMSQLERGLRFAKTEVKTFHYGAPAAYQLLHAQFLRLRTAMLAICQAVEKNWPEAQCSIGLMHRYPSMDELDTEIVIKTVEDLVLRASRNERKLLQLQEKISMDSDKISFHGFKPGDLALFQREADGTYRALSTDRTIHQLTIESTRTVAKSAGSPSELLGRIMTMTPIEKKDGTDQVFVSIAAYPEGLHHHQTFRCSTPPF